MTDEALAPRSRSDREFLEAALARGDLAPAEVAEALASQRRAETFLSRPVPIAHLLRQQRWLTPAQVAELGEATRQRILLCAHCWARTNVFDLIAGEKFNCGGCSRLVATPLEEDAERLAVVGAREVVEVGAAAALAGQGFVEAREVGYGAAGVVYRALRLPARRWTAVKVLHRDLEGDEQAVRRFFREARAAAIDHPNLVPIHHAGRAGGCAFLVMEWVPGGNLREALASGGPPAPARAYAIAREVARGLEAAHTRGVIHRDVKPSNILLPAGAEARLADFGLARAPGRPESLAITRSGESVGTAYYTAPEQARDPRTAVPASDVYSLGATLFHMLTGAPPFAGVPWPEIAARLAAGRIPRLDSAPLVNRMMAARPEDRFADGGEAARALEG